MAVSRSRIRGCLGVVLFACSALAAAGCCGSPAVGLDGGADGGGASAPDAGDGGFCTEVGQSCIAVNNCCDPTTTCVPSAGYVCIPILNVDGGPDGGSDGGPPDAGPDAGLSDGGLFDGGFPDGGPFWSAEVVEGSLAAIDGISTPTPAVRVAVGAGSGQGGLLFQADAGTATWWPLAAVPATASLLDVWADSHGDLFAVGQIDGGSALLSGNLDGGLSLIAVPSAQALLSVVGLIPGEAIAVGIGASGMALALHLTPDGGLSTEALPAGLGTLSRVRGAGMPAGPFAALGVDALAGAQVLLRADGGWSELPATGAQDLTDLTFGPTGDLVVVGDDGNGNGLAYRWNGTAFVPIDLSSLPIGAPGLRAVVELSAGELYIAAGGSAATKAESTVPEILHGAAGGWSIEKLPPTSLDINGLSADDAGNLFAAGRQFCQDCPSVPLILKREP